MEAAPLQRWLEAERNDQNGVADAAFAHLLADVPRTRASAAFTARTVQAVWRTRTRRQRIARLARLAVTVVIAVGSVAFAYAAARIAISGLVSGAVFLSHVVVWVTLSAEQGMTWWSIAVRAATSVSHVLTLPSIATALAVAEAAVISAMYAFQWLLRHEPRTRGAQKESI